MAGEDRRPPEQHGTPYNFKSQDAPENLDEIYDNYFHMNLKKSFKVTTDPKTNYIYLDPIGKNSPH